MPFSDHYSMKITISIRVFQMVFKLLQSCRREKRAKTARKAKCYEKQAGKNHLEGGKTFYDADPKKASKLRFFFSWKFRGNLWTELVVKFLSASACRETGVNVDGALASAIVGFHSTLFFQSEGKQSEEMAIWEISKSDKMFSLLISRHFSTWAPRMERRTNKVKLSSFKHEITWVLYAN